jgi:hypothetical protein
MSLDLNALASRTVDFMGQSAKITYNPSVLTSANFNRTKQGDEEFAAFFTELVTDWDVKRGAKKVPLTLVGLQGVPILFLKAVFQQIMQLKDGDVEEGKASNAG